MMFNKYGMNLRLSNELPLNRSLPDFRLPECKVLSYPVREFPKVSIIIIYYNEPLSTLVRNVVSVFNRTPRHLLGEIVLVDDKSSMEELKFLDEHLDQLSAADRALVRIVHRDVHNGIVGARTRGAEESKYNIIVFLDSHGEVCDGWLEPLLDRIHGDSKRVVVPHIRGIEYKTLELSPGPMWPPAKGSFNWRLSFTIVPANMKKDLDPKKNPHISPILSPVMPGELSFFNI